MAITTTGGTGESGGRESFNNVQYRYTYLDAVYSGKIAATYGFSNNWVSTLEAGHTSGSEKGARLSTSTWVPPQNVPMPTDYVDTGMLARGGYQWTKFAFEAGAFAWFSSLLGPVVVPSIAFRLTPTSRSYYFADFLAEADLYPALMIRLGGGYRFDSFTLHGSVGAANAGNVQLGFDKHFLSGLSLGATATGFTGRVFTPWAFSTKISYHFDNNLEPTP